MAEKAKVSRVSIQINIGNLLKYRWVVYTLDEMTQSAIAEYLSRQGCGGLPTKLIEYREKQYECFVVPFEVVQFLLKNRERCQYQYASFYQSRGDRPFKLWLEGRKTPDQYLSKLLEKWNIVKLKN